MMEPYGEKLFEQWLRQFPQLMFYGSHQHHLNNVEWHLSYSLPELLTKSMPSSNKIQGLCAVVSSRSSDPGQRYRLELVRALDQLSLPAVGGVMIVSRLHENPKRSKDLIQRLEQLETQQKERQKKELARKNPRKKNKKPITDCP